MRYAIMKPSKVWFDWEAEEIEDLDLENDLVQTSDTFKEVVKPGATIIAEDFYDSKKTHTGKILGFNAHQSPGRVVYFELEDGFGFIDGILDGSLIKGIR